MPGTWIALDNPPPFNASTMLLLTDGTVMCQNQNAQEWWRLSPDSNGDYLKGTWTPLAPMRNARLFYASAVLADGRVFVAGGEYNGGGAQVELDAAEIYDPLTNTWSDLPTPGWGYIGDAPCCVLTNGRVLLGDISLNRASVWDPSTNTWTPTGPKEDRSSEETWVLLPDGSVLTAECDNHPNAERYAPDTNTWVSAGQIKPDL